MTSAGSQIDSAFVVKVLLVEELHILLACLNVRHGQMNENDDTSVPLLTDGEAKHVYARTKNNSDRIVTYSARLSFKDKHE